MDYGLQAEISLISLWNFGALIVNIIAYIILYTKARRTASLRAFLLVLISVMIWLVGKILKTVSPTIELRWIFIVFYYFGIFMLQATFLEFGYIYYKGKKMPKGYKVIVYFVVALQFLFVATNPLHHKFYSEFTFSSDSFGKYFYVLIGIEYAYIFIGMILCGKKLKTQVREVNKIYKYIIFTAILVPLILNIIYITGVLKNAFYALGIQVFDITPIVFTWSLLLFIYATFKYEFFELSPLMKHEIITKINNPIIIINRQYEILFTNEMFKKSLIQNDTCETIVEKLKQYLTPKDILLSKKNLSVIVEYDNSYYKVDFNNIIDDKESFIVIVFTDISMYMKYKEEVVLKNLEIDKANARIREKIEKLKELSLKNASMFVARELHDVIGHSLVVSMKLLEVSKLIYFKDKKEVYETLNASKLTIINGIEEINRITKEGSDFKYSFRRLEIELNEIIKDVELSGLKVKMYTRNNNEAMKSNVYIVLIKIIKELITNVLKHSSADSVFISMISLDKELEIQLMDNGKGCKKLIKGNGLRGIESRLLEIGGNVVFNTSINDGFASIIKIPMI